MVICFDMEVPEIASDIFKTKLDIDSMGETVQSNQ